MFAFWILAVALTSALFRVHCLDWAYLIRKRQLRGYFIETPGNFIGDLASAVAYFAFLVLVSRQALGVAQQDGLYLECALTVMFSVGVRRSFTGIRINKETP
ncbi:hypothetical protein PQQ96_41935 [Paraburkholderia sediminicola]|uniref:hypothetical protein n=1 Tax=Paraburkholderia sediminicola TaxID=458836 RepID=UPI0038BD1B9F